jgi:hypothetical protein
MSRGRGFSSGAASLMSVAEIGTMDQRRCDSGMPRIWCWQARAMAERVDSFLHEAEPAAAPTRTDKSQTEAVRPTQPGWASAETRTRPRSF